MGAGGRWNGRPNGDPSPRARGRDAEISPLRLPAARVHPYACQDEARR